MAYKGGDSLAVSVTQIVLKSATWERAPKLFSSLYPLEGARLPSFAPRPPTAPPWITGLASPWGFSMRGFPGSLLITSTARISSVPGTSSLEISNPGAPGGRSLGLPGHL